MAYKIKKPKSPKKKNPAVMLRFRDVGSYSGKNVQEAFETAQRESIFKSKQAFLLDMVSFCLMESGYLVHSK